MVADPELYRSLHRRVGYFFSVYNGFRVEGVEHIPADGGALICPRHENLSDPFFVAAALPRELHFLAWDGVERMPFFGALFQRLGVVHTVKTSIGKSTDHAGVRRTMEALKDLVVSGRLCAIFPEGNINHWLGRGGLKPFRSGAVRLAAKAKVPIIPTGLTGTRWVVPSLFNFSDVGGPDFAPWIPMALPARVRLRFGEPFHVDGAAASNKVVAERETARLQEVVAALIAGMREPLPSRGRPPALSSRSDTRAHKRRRRGPEHPDAAAHADELRLPLGSGPHLSCNGETRGTVSAITWLQGPRKCQLSLFFSHAARSVRASATSLRS